MGLYVSESWVNLSKGYRCGDSGVYEAWMETPGEAFRAFRKEHGRCAGRVYVDLPGKPATPIGWVFVKRQRYEDSRETFLCETWITLHVREPETVTTEYPLNVETGEAA